jgi:hypothetical protein
MATPDGTIEILVITQNAYDSRARLVQATSHTDSNGDRLIDNVSVVSIVYDGVKH